MAYPNDLSTDYYADPASWFDGWAEDGTDITVPLAAFPELTAAEADAATGSIADVLYAIAHRAYAAFNSIPAASRPANWVAYKAETPVAGADDRSRISFTFSFLTSVPAGQRNVVAEA
jgi:hypothetical protein